MRLNIPSALTLILGILGGVLEYLNQATFSIGLTWHELITFGLYAVAVFGVAPLTHSAFRNALHLTVPEATVVTSLAALLAAAVTTFSLSPDIKGIIEALIAFLAFVGFGPNGVSPVAVTPAAR